MKRLTWWIPSILVLSACSDAELDARRQIERELQVGVDATRTQDIDAYMAQLPVDLKIHDESGAVISREQLRANVLRDWATIDRTLSIDVVIDSLTVTTDSAVVFTSQRWERLMFRRDGVTLDTVLTTQAHRETWRRTASGWRGFSVEELGGAVWINNELYEPGSASQP